MQYYYAHAPKDFTVEGAKHFKEDGKIYGGDPVLIKTVSTEEAHAKAQAAANAPKIKKITKHSWCDEEKKVKIYIDTDQFKAGEIKQEMVDVNFETFGVEIKVIDAEGTTHVLNLFKLYEKVEPENCSWRFKPNRITIVLKKWLETSWKELVRAPGKKA